MEEQQKLILSIAVVLVVLAALAGALYWEWKKLSAAQADLAAKEQEAQQLHQRIQNDIPRLKKELAEKQARVAEYEKTLPSAKEVESMDETLNAYKLQAGVQLLERRPVRETGRRQVPGQVQLYYKYSYRLTMTADFFAWVKFVNLLENHERFIRVDEFDVKVEDEESGLLNITMKISTFSYAKVQTPAAPTPGAAAAAVPVGAR